MRGADCVASARSGTERKVVALRHENELHSAAGAGRFVQGVPEAQEEGSRRCRASGEGGQPVLLVSFDCGGERG